MEEELLVCPVCGRSNLKLLGRHMKLTHKLSKDEINEKYPGLKLMTDSERTRIESSLTKYREENWQDEEYRVKMKNASYTNMEAIHQDPEKLAKGQKLSYESRMKHAEEDPDWWFSVRSTSSKHAWQNQSRRDAQHDMLVDLWKNPEYRTKQTNRFIKMLNDTWADPEKAKKSFFGYRTTKSYEYLHNDEKYYFRSSWELLLAEFLDTHDIEWEYESISIKYEYNGEKHRYIPDFYLKKYNLLLEVKPNAFVNEQVMAKLEYSKLAGYSIKLITEDHLWLDESSLLEYLESSTTIER